MHGEALRKAVDVEDETGFTAQVAEDWRSADLPENEQAMLEYVEKITFSASTMTQDDTVRLQNLGWSDRDILDIVLVSAYYNFRCRMADALGVELDEGRVDATLQEEFERRKVTPVR